MKSSLDIVLDLGIEIDIEIETDIKIVIPPDVGRNCSLLPSPLKRRTWDTSLIPMKTQVPCVSSVSQLDDEESASESSTELKVYTQLSSTNPQAFDRPLLAPSPAPVPIQGGEDEVIRVSAVRKIKVNSTEQVFKTKNIVEAPPPRKQEDQPIPPTSDSSIQLQTPDIADMPKRIITNPETDGDESHSDSEPMTVIEKSPYENNMDAEKGVELFTKMKNVLKERNEGDDYRTVHEEATKIFGPTNAWCLVKANCTSTHTHTLYTTKSMKPSVDSLGT